MNNSSPQNIATKSNINTDRGNDNNNLPLKSSFTTRTVNITPSRTSPTNKAMIGIGVSPNLRSNTIIKAKDGLDAISMGAQETYKQLTAISNGLIMAASNGFQGAEIGIF